MADPGTWAAIIIAVAGTTYGITEQKKAAHAQEKAQKKANAIQRRTAQMQHEQRIRRAEAEKRKQQADLVQQAEALGTSANSSLTTSVGSLDTQVAVDTGAASTLLAGDYATQQTLFKGQRRANRHNTNAAIGQSVASLALMGASMYSPGTGQGTTQRPSSFRRSAGMRRANTTPRFG